MSAQSFICSSCGKEHEGLPTDWAFKFPDEIHALPYLDEYRRSRSNADVCTFDESRFFIRGLLQIPFKHQEGEFAWGIWLEVSKQTHDLYIDNFRNDSIEGTKSVGILANSIQGAILVAGQPFNLIFQNSKSRPFFYFPSESTHELALEQRNGIDASRHHEYLELCGYFDESDA